MFDRLVLICLAVFFILYGILAVTNIEIVWSRPIMGFAALIVGLVCGARALSGGGWPAK